MRKIKLLLAAMAAMVGLGAQAQSWTASEVGAGDFLLYNVGTGQYFTRGNNYGSRASITASGFEGNAMAVRLVEYSGKYQLLTGLANNAYGVEYLSGGTVYLDQSRNKQSTWTFTEVETDNGPVYNIISADNHGGGSGVYLTAEGGTSTIVGSGNDGSLANAKWKLISFETIRTETLDKLSGATEESPVNATPLIVDADFSYPFVKKDAWTMVSSNQNLNGGLPGGSGDVTPQINPCAESWQAAFTLSQEITVPNGVYELTAQAAVTEYNATGVDLPVIYANEETASFTAMTHGENSLTGVSTQFTAGNYVVGPIRVVVTNGSLTIGVRGTRTNTWCVWDNFQLSYKGVDLEALKDALQDKIDAVPALEGTTTAAAYNAAKDYADGIEMSSLTTEDAIAETTNELSNLIDAAKALQTNYTRYNNIKTAALAISENVATSESDAVVAAATTNEALVAAIASLRAAFLTELPNVNIPVDPGYIDVTSVMVDNAGVRQNTDFWTSYKYPSSPDGGSFGKCANNECEFYQQHFKFYQTLSLARGTWEFGVTGFHRAGNHNTHFYAGEDKILIPGVSSSVVNTMDAAETYFDSGEGKVALKFVIEGTQDVEIGINNQDAETDKWTIFRDFTLKYYGEPDYSVYDTQWTETVTAANEALNAAAYKYVSGNERTAVTEAIADEPDGTSKANYLEKIQALEEATQTFTAAAPSYNAWVLAKTATTNLWGSTLGVAVPATAAEAAAGPNALKVAEYNYVKTNYPYSLNSKIGEFSSWTKTATSGGAEDTPQTRDNEHWSGATHTYYEQGAKGWDANSFTVTYSQTTTLPVGAYVIKVAARASSDVTGTISVTATDKTVALPNVGAASKGITTDGVASFDEGTFAKDGTGFGWQWRFLPFTLAEDGEVTITIHAETSMQHNWVSIADAELLSAADIATPVAYNDAEDNTPIEDVDLANVTITRNVKVGFNTVVLPFDLTEAQVNAAFGTGSEVYSYAENSDDPDNVAINFTKVTQGTISANVPVLVKATEESTEQVFEGVQIVAAESAKVEGKNFDFVGVYAPTDFVPGDFFLSGTEIFKATAASTQGIKGFRAYFQAKGEEPASVKMYIDGLETSIRSINGMKAQPAGAIYNLAGQRMSKAQKGIFIVGGKKMVIK